MCFVLVQGPEKYSTTEMVPQTSDLIVSQTPQEPRNTEFIRTLGTCNCVTSIMTLRLQKRLCAHS